jgi:hypothetical protein
MAAEGLRNFTEILIDASNPEASLARIKAPCDLFLSTYVFELLPCPEYGLRVLKIAHDLLAPDGMAIVQVKYSEADDGVTQVGLC